MQGFSKHCAFLKFVLITCILALITHSADSKCRCILACKLQLPRVNQAFSLLPSSENSKPRNSWFHERLRALWNLPVVKEVLPSLANDCHPSKPSLLNRNVQEALDSEVLMAHVLCWAHLSQCSFILRCCSAHPAGVNVCDLLVFETGSLLDHSAAVLIC